MESIINYIMVWIEEDEKWYYYINNFDKKQFKYGYVDYCVEVRNGLITKDEFKTTNVGKSFVNTYDLNLWRL